MVPLFEIDVIKTADAYEKLKTIIEENDYEPNVKAFMELHRAQEAFNREMEEINMGISQESWTLSIAKELLTLEKEALIELLR